MKRLFSFLCVLCCASVMGFAINWGGYNWLGNGGVDGKYNSKIKATVSPSLGTGFINNLQTNGGHASIHIAMPSAEFGAISLDAADYHTEGAGFFPHLDAFKKQETEFTVVCSGTTYTFTVYYEDGEPEDLTGWNIAKGKTAYAGHVAENGIAAANDGNKGTRWGSNGASHYAAVGENAGDWWYVDLGDFYQVNQIKILFETAAPTDYDLLISNNAASWTVIGTYTTQPKTGNTDENYNVYNFTDKVGRYVKIFARNGYNSMQYGISIWEFEVYGDHASIDDHNPPSMTSASLSGTPSYNQVTIAVAGTDPEDGVVTQFHVVDATHGVDQSQTAEAGVITVTGLNAETSYTFTITALDAAGNESANSVNVSATTTQDTSIPLVAAPVPSGTGKEIIPIYSDAFASILEHDFDKDGFAGVTLMMEQNINGDHSLVYNVAGANEATWGMYNDGGDAIIAQSEYRGSGMGVDASAMEYLHIDIWSLQAGTNVININVNDAGLTSLRLSHSGNGWQGYDIAMSDFGFNPANPSYSSDNVRWMKFTGIGFISGKMALDNVYFWKTATGLQSVSVTANNASFGTASVVVTETGLAPEGGMVTDGTEVTFSATPNDGYIFVNWSNGETNATFNAEVNSTMNLTANFRAIKTVYCMTEMEKNGHTIYVTMKRSAADTYQLVVRANEELQGFGNAYFYRPNNIQVGNISQMQELSDNNHTLTATMTAATEPYMTTPLYVIIRGVGEVAFDQLTDIEYAAECDDNASVTSVTISRTIASVAVGDEFDLTAQVVPAFATNKNITWSSDNTSVATVTSAGHVATLAEGTARITATSVDGGYTATCTVTVNAELETQTYWGNGSNSGIAIAYSITRNSDYTLTYVLDVLHQKTGFVPEVNYPDENAYHNMTYDNESQTYSHTTTLTYSDGDVINGFFWLKYEGGVVRIDFTYTVGSSSERQAYIPIEFDDNAEDASWINENDGKTRDVEIDRTLLANGYYKTICFPFSMDAEQIEATFGNCEILMLSGGHMKSETDIYVQYVPVHEIIAGKPYLMTNESEVAGLDFSGVLINSSTANNEIEVDLGGGKKITMIGTFVKKSLTDDDLYYLDIDGFLHSVSAYGSENSGAAVTIAAFRCYYQFEGFNNPAGVRARVVRVTDVVTGCEDLTEPTVATKQLRNGQLLIFRDGKSYTVTGLRIE